tara:strand:- start:809 stop:1315 length:507 start_codon:yes stop_codon:yes gene_type:complete
MHPGGNIIRITPTISATAYDAADVLFLTTEIPNAVGSRGGVSLLRAVSYIGHHDATDDINLVFMENSKDLIGTLSPGSSGGPTISEANVEAANMIGHVIVDTSTNIVDLGNSRLYTTGMGNSAALQFPILLKAAEGSTSVYVGGICDDAQDYSAVDDLTLIFHVEYLS